MSKRSNGSGSAARKRADGRWAVHVIVTESGTNRRVRRTLYGRSRKEVEEKRTELLAASARHEPIPPTKLTVGIYLEEWLEHVARPRVRPTTLRSYERCVRSYLVPGLGRRPLGQLSAREVRMFLDGLLKEGRGARTVQYVHATLRVALEDATREELIAKNVAKLVRAPKPAEREHDPLSVDEVRQLFRAHRDSPLLPMLAVFALLGLRRSEVLGLKWEDVDLDGGVVQVRRSVQRVEEGLVEMPTKTARSRRSLPLPGIVVELLHKQADQQAKWRVDAGGAYAELGYVFSTPIGTPMDPRNCTRVVQKACVDAGLRKVRLHDFRHGCVSVLLELGVPPRTVMEIVGHSALEMTMNVYGHVNLSAKREAMNQVGRLFEEEP